jgi:hypothetical protein
LAHEAARQGFEVLYTTADQLLRHLHAGRADDSTDKRLAGYLAPDLLVIDQLARDQIRSALAFNIDLARLQRARNSCSVLWRHREGSSVRRGKREQSTVKAKVISAGAAAILAASLFAHFAPAAAAQAESCTVGASGTTTSITYSGPGAASDCQNVIDSAGPPYWYRASDPPTTPVTGEFVRVYDQMHATVRSSDQITNRFVANEFTAPVWTRAGATTAGCPRYIPNGPDGDPNIVHLDPACLGDVS